MMEKVVERTEEDIALEEMELKKGTKQRCGHPKVRKREKNN
jgi:hypothetical protein